MASDLPSQMECSSPNSSDAVAARGHAYYDRELKDQLLKSHKGQYLVLNTETFEYEVDPNAAIAARRMLERFPESGRNVYNVRIGYQLTFGASPRYVEESE